jgi:Fungal N-terminal domain of STAND proteins
MAEPISLASGLLALATFAFQSSITLYNTIQSYQSHPKRVRDLIEELEALSGVLAPLAETVSATTDVDLSALDLPLLRCGNSCKEFEQEIKKCSTRSGGSRTSFRDWAKLRYMGEDIDGFRRLLAGYKLTISIALTDANLYVFMILRTAKQF